MSKHDDYTNWVLAQVRNINPYTNKEQGHIYAYGFLASYLATVLEQDPLAFKQFKRHCELRAKQSRP